MLSFFLSYLLLYKYTLLSAVVLVASFGFPLPATALLMAAGAFAAQGYFDFRSILICGFFATVIGDLLGYFVSFHYGRKVLLWIGLKRVINSPRFTTMEGIFLHHSGMAIFSTRFLATSLGPVVNLLSGFSKVTLRRFLTLDLLGEALYVALFASLGYTFGDQWEAISSISQDVMIIVVLVLVLAVLSVVAWRVRNGKKHFTH